MGLGILGPQGPWEEEGALGDRRPKKGLLLQHLNNGLVENRKLKIKVAKFLRYGHISLET